MRVNILVTTNQTLSGSDGPPTLIEIFEEPYDILALFRVALYVGFGEMPYHKVIKRSEVLGHFAAGFHIKNHVQFVDYVLGAADTFALGLIIIGMHFNDGLFQKLYCSVIEHDNEFATVLSAYSGFFISIDSLHFTAPGYQILLVTSY